MRSIDRDRFLEQGYLIVKEAVPSSKLERLRRAYETLVDRQRNNWKAERKEGDPPGGEWEKSAQPRLLLQRPPLVNQLDRETAPAVEVWMEENIRGNSLKLLDESDAAVTEMMMMCSPIRDHGPAKWHRDIHPIDTAPLQGYIDDIVEGGPRYLQWNIPLYDDSVLWVVPGSHLRCNTPEENERLSEDPCQSLPGGVRTHLEAGDGVVYITPILHWGSNYSTRLRRTVHGGFSVYSCFADLSFVDSLSTEAANAFERWDRQTREMKSHTESALRAVIDADRAAFQDALDRLHPRRGEKGKILSTVFLCKAALSVRLSKDPPYPEVSEDLAGRVHGSHYTTLNWGPEFADRFSSSDADSLWQRFEPLDKLLQSEEEQFFPGFQSGPMMYHFNEMPPNYTTSEFISSWV